MHSIIPPYDLTSIFVPSRLQLSKFLPMPPPIFAFRNVRVLGYTKKNECSWKAEVGGVFVRKEEPTTWVRTKEKWVTQWTFGGDTVQPSGGRKAHVKNGRSRGLLPTCTDGSKDARGTHVRTRRLSEVPRAYINCLRFRKNGYSQ